MRVRYTIERQLHRALAFPFDCAVDSVSSGLRIRIALKMLYQMLLILGHQLIPVLSDDFAGSQSSDSFPFRVNITELMTWVAFEDADWARLS